ncbi:MAG: L,D-transpeptidase family protein, partial [Cyanobacteria bacterium]|nr:L,D-transpeptidase family protein [Cyanobacteriota bacterium]
MFRPSLRSPGRHVASPTSAAFLALLALGPAFAQPPALAGASTPGPSATAKPATKRPQPPPPLVAPGAAALLGGPEPLQIGGSQGTAPVPGAVPQVPLAPLVPDAPTVAPPGPVSLVLDRRRRLLTVVEKGLPLRRFPVAVGMPGWETPVGTFRVLEKTINPIWEHPEKGTHTASVPANPLGSRWIGFYQDCQGR